MQVRCTFCRNAFDLSKDYMAFAVEKSETKGHKYHSVECPRCRKTIKVSVAQMKPFVPAEETEGEEEGEKQ